MITKLIQRMNIDISVMLLRLYWRDLWVHDLAISMLIHVCKGIGDANSPSCSINILNVSKIEICHLAHSTAPS